MDVFIRDINIKYDQQGTTKECTFECGLLHFPTYEKEPSLQSILDFNDRLITQKEFLQSYLEDKILFLLSQELDILSEKYNFITDYSDILKLNTRIILEYGIHPRKIHYINKPLINKDEMLDYVATLNKFFLENLELVATYYIVYITDLDLEKMKDVIIKNIGEV